MRSSHFFQCQVELTEEKKPEVSNIQSEVGCSMSTYVIFDGDNDQWAYRYIRGWDANPNIPFSFYDSHDLDGMTASAQNEAYVKGKLRERMKKSDSVLVLIGETTRHLYKFVRWEIELALELDLPVVAVNLNKQSVSR